jgi:hypothetical protein
MEDERLGRREVIKLRRWEGGKMQRMGGEERYSLTDQIRRASSSIDRRDIGD